MRIGILAAKAGCRAGTIRYYESIGLLPSPERSEGDYRQYAEWHLERLRFLLQCRALGMSIEDIRTLLKHRDNPARSCEGIDLLIESSIANVQVQIASLRHLEGHLKELRSRCSSPRQAGDCGILARLSEDKLCKRDVEI